MRVCTVCSTSSEESARFCPRCGAVTTELTDAATLPVGVALVDAESPSPGATDGTTAPHGTEGPVPATSLLGASIDGQFKLEAVIGSGAFGVVYKGTQVGLDRPVAVKVPTHAIASDPIMARRFAREARSAARVQHPGIVTIYAVGELPDGRPYLAMELIDGAPLGTILAGGPLPPPRALAIVRSIASALSETHASGIVHRDLKPSNIIWRRDRNGDDRITLVDFGIAIARPGNADASRLTADGLVGTPHYMSPEQAHGDQVDARADLYALGCILFELVTATTPYDGSAYEVLLAHMGRPAPSPSERTPSVPAAVDQLCATLMAKQPSDRPANADLVVARIDQLLGELGRALPPASPPPARPAKPSKPPRQELPTRRDLPAGAVRGASRRAPRPPRGALLALGALASMGAGGLIVYTIGDARLRAAPPPDASAAAAADPDPYVGRRDVLFKDNGEMIVRVLVPSPLTAGQEIRARVEVRNKLGQAVNADEIVLTIADDTGAAKGLTARPRRDSQREGKYYFGYQFPRAGHYTLRVFPPSVDSSFEIPLDVL